LRDIIKEAWVYSYALALSKITVSRPREKYSGLQMFGGQMFNSAGLLQEGLTEKKELEEQLFTGAAAGMGDADPVCFFMG
jgi:hypothetical protein